MSMIFLATLLMASAEPVVPAEPVEEKNLISGKVKRDPARGYIFLHGEGRQLGAFIRVPDKEDITAYEADRQKAYDKEKKRYAARLARWPQDVATATQLKKEPPEKPVLEDYENFSIGDIERRTIEMFGADYVYNKDKTKNYYSYLTSVKPGTYIWYGPIQLIPDVGYAGFCYCMGTVQFEVKPGIVTNLGNFLSLSPPVSEAESELLPEVRFTHMFGSSVVRTSSTAEPDYAIPATLAEWPAEKGELHAAGKVNNFFGIVISRLPPVPGILSYRRDVVIDERSGTPIVTKTAASR